MFRGILIAAALAAVVAIAGFDASPAQAGPNGLPGEVCGRAWLDVNIEGVSASNVYDEGIDPPIPGVDFYLERVDENGFPLEVFGPATTDSLGEYRFAPPPLAGDYRIRVSGLEPTPFAARNIVVNGSPRVPDLELTETPVTEPFEITGAATEPTTVDLPLVRDKPEDDPPPPPGSVHGRTWFDTPGGVTNTYEETDAAIGGVEFFLERLDPNGYPLEVFGPMPSNSLGQYVFDPPPAGMYRVRASGLEPTPFAAEVMLVNGNDENFDLTETPVTEPFEITGAATEPTTVDLPLVRDKPEDDPPPPPGSVHGRVWFDIPGGMPNVYEESDPTIPGVSFFLERLENALPVEVFGPVESDSLGQYRFDPPPPGMYQVRVSGLEPTPFAAMQIRVDDVPQEFEITETPVTEPFEITGAATEPTTVDLPLVEDKPEDEPAACRQSCTKGRLHEALVLTDIWMGDLADSVAVSVALLDGCRRSSRAVDVVRVEYPGTSFPGPVTGLDEVLTIEDVQIHNGWGTVRVRITANPRVFPRGAFGRAWRHIAVSLNGRRNVACQSLTCRLVQPGDRFPMRGGYFRVVDTVGWDSWAECHPDDAGPRPGAGQPPTKPKKSRKSVKPKKSGKSKQSAKSAKSKHSEKSAKIKKSKRSKESAKSRKSDKSKESAKSKKSDKKAKGTNKSKKKDKKKPKKQRHVLQPALVPDRGDGDEDRRRRGRQKPRRGRPRR